LPKNPFTQSEFLEIWNSYAQLLIRKGDKSLASILMASRPIVTGLKVQYPLPNNMMKEQLERERPRLLKHIRESLNNFSIDLTIDVKEVEVKKFVYTPQEKYDKLKELNPDIELLRKLFSLDL